MNQIPTLKISEILREEFMIPFNLSAYALAKAIHVPVTRIQDILNDHRKITVDTSIRLAKFFGVSDKYFLNLQMILIFGMQKLRIRKIMKRLN